MRKIVTVNDRMQKGYRYSLVAPTGRSFDPDFKPEVTPKELLELGVFCGKYMTDCRREFPGSWFKRAKHSPARRDCSLNYFGVDASQPLLEWKRKGWNYPDDPRGWFQWYCRYYLWVAAYLTKTDDRSDGGEPSAVTSRNFVRIANQGTGFAGPDNGKPCSSGLMTVVRYNR